MIARDLGLSVSTVDNYISEAKAVLEVSTRREATIVFENALRQSPEIISGQSPRVVDIAAPDQSPESTVGVTRKPRSLEHLTRFRRLLLAIGGALLLSVGLGLSVVIIAGAIFLFDPAHR